MGEKLTRRAFLRAAGAAGVAAIATACGLGPKDGDIGTGVEEKPKETPVEGPVTGAVEGINPTPTPTEGEITVAERLGITADKDIIDEIKRHFPTNTYIETDQDEKGRITVLRISLFDNKEKVSTPLPWDRILCLKHLKTANFVCCEIDSVPTGITDLEQLEFLGLPSNIITETGLPQQMAEMKNLKGLDLRANRFDTFPLQITRIKGLERLFLEYNQLRGVVPSEIRNLVALRVLDLSNNSLDGFLPAQIGELLELRVLDLSNNFIDGLPPDIGKLGKLEVLRLSNGLEHLPESMEVMGGLLELDLIGNPELTNLGSLPKGLQILKIGNTGVTLSSFTDSGTISRLKRFEIASSRFEQDLMDNGVNKKEFLKRFPNLNNETFITSLQ